MDINNKVLIPEKEIKRRLGRGKDIRGEKYERLLPLYPLEERTSTNQIIWHFLCDCGNECDIIGSKVSTGKTKSCGCLQREVARKQHFKNLIGQNFGRLTVISLNKEKSKKKSYWNCLCECGNKCTVSADHLTKGDAQSCGCLRKEITSINKSKDLTGQTFGNLIAIKRLPPSAICKEARYICRCKCGNETIVIGSNLSSGHTQSCGCIKSKGEEKISKILKKANINFKTQKTFNSCRFKDTNALAKFDFYLPDYNVLIEYDGEQHFNYRDTGWNTEENFKKTQQRDNYKNQWCKENNISLIRIPYTYYNDLCLNDLLPQTTKFLL